MLFAYNDLFVLRFLSSMYYASFLDNYSDVVTAIFYKKLPRQVLNKRLTTTKMKCFFFILVLTAQGLLVVNNPLTTEPCDPTKYLRFLC